jgi:hypothetical protein
MARKLDLALGRGQRTQGREAIVRLDLDATVEAVVQIYQKLWRTT